MHKAVWFYFPGAALAEGSHVSFPRTSLLGYAYSFVRHPLLRIGVWGLMAVMAGNHLARC